MLRKSIIFSVFFLNDRSVYPFLLSMVFVILLSNILVLFPFDYFSLELFPNVFILTSLTWGAFSYPLVFLVTDLTNCIFGKQTSLRIVYAGFVLAIAATFVTGLLFYDNFISFARIGLASGTAFFISQLLDIETFNLLRSRAWFIPPAVSSILGSSFDSLLFFSIAFYGTDLDWFSMAIDDYIIKCLYAITLLVPYYFLRRRLIG